MRKVTVFWEDSRGVASKGYGPGDFLTACVADALELRSPYDLRGAIASMPLNGNGNVVNRIKQVGTRGTPYPAIFTLDSDRLDDLFRAHSLSPHPCKSARKSAIRDHWEHNGAAIVFVERNIEDILSDVQSLASGYPGLERLPWDGALKKQLQDRDRVFQAATGPDYQNLRHQVKRKNSSFNYLVTAVTNALSRPEP